MTGERPTDATMPTASKGNSRNEEGRLAAAGHRGRAQSRRVLRFPRGVDARRRGQPLLLADRASGQRARHHRGLRHAALRPTGGTIRELARGDAPAVVASIAIARQNARTGRELTGCPTLGAQRWTLRRPALGSSSKSQAGCPMFDVQPAPTRGRRLIASSTAASGYS